MIGHIAATGLSMAVIDMTAAVTVVIDAVTATMTVQTAATVETIVQIGEIVEMTARTDVIAERIARIDEIVGMTARTGEIGVMIAQDTVIVTAIPDIAVEIDAMTHTGRETTRAMDTIRAEITAIAIGIAIHPGAMGVTTPIATVTGITRATADIIRITAVR